MQSNARTVRLHLVLQETEVKFSPFFSLVERRDQHLQDMTVEMENFFETIIFWKRISDQMGHYNQSN